MRRNHNTALVLLCIIVFLVSCFVWPKQATAANGPTLSEFWDSGSQSLISQPLAKPKTWTHGAMKLSITGIGIDRDPTNSGYLLVIMAQYSGLPEGCRLSGENIKLIGPRGPISRASFLGTFGGGWSNGPSTDYLNFQLPAKDTSVLKEFSGKFDNQHEVQRLAGPYTIESLKKPALLTKSSQTTMQLFDWSVVDSPPIGLDTSGWRSDETVRPKPDGDYGYMVIRLYSLDLSDTTVTPEAVIYGPDGTEYKTVAMENWAYTEGNDGNDVSYLGIEFDSWHQGSSVQKGKRIGSVMTGSPADKAGIRAGDILLQADGVPMDPDPNIFPCIGEDMPPGTPLDVIILRNGKKLTFTPILEADPRWIGMAANASGIEEDLRSLLPPVNRQNDNYNMRPITEQLYCVLQPVKKDFVPAKLGFKVTETVRATKTIPFSLRNIPIPPKIQKELKKHSSAKPAFPEPDTEGFDPFIMSGKMVVRDLPKPLVWKQNESRVSLTRIGRGKIKDAGGGSDQDSLIFFLRSDELPSGSQFRSSKALNQSGEELKVCYNSIGLPGSSTSASTAFTVGKETVTSLRELSGKFDDSREVHRVSDAYSLDDLLKPLALGKDGDALLLVDYSVSQLPAARVNLVDIEYMSGKLPLPKPDPGNGYLVFRFFNERGERSTISEPALEIQGADGKWSKTRMEYTNAFCIHDAGKWEPSYFGLQTALGSYRSDRTSPRISSVDPEGPAARAGIQTGDVISRLGTEELRSAFALLGGFDSKMEPEKPIPATVLRDGKSLNLTITPVPDPLWTGMFQRRAEVDSKLNAYLGKVDQTHLAGYSYTYPVPVPLNYRPTKVRFAYDDRTAPTKTISFIFRDVPIPTELRHSAAK